MTLSISLLVWNVDNLSTRVALGKNLLQLKGREPSSVIGHITRCFFPLLADSMCVAMCCSVISLATRCAMPSFRMHLRARGKVTQVFKALSDAPQHPVMNQICIQIYPNSCSFTFMMHHIYSYVNLGGSGWGTPGCSSFAFLPVFSMTSMHCHPCEHSTLEAP